MYLTVGRSSIERHRTAIERSSLSRPVRMALDDGVIDHGTEVLDYGCGKGGDVERLRAKGVSVRGYDPHYEPEGDRSPADVVALIYVVNVIEDPKERAKVLRTAWKAAKKALVVAARLESENKGGGESYRDGVRTSLNTFQKYFTQGELADWIQEVLGQEVVPAGPGVFYVVRDKSLRKRLEEQATPLAVGTVGGPVAGMRRVGKVIGGRHYVHRDYAHLVVPRRALDRAVRIAEEIYPNHTWEMVRYRSSTGDVTFIDSPDFNEANEPTVGDSVTVRSNGAATRRAAPADPEIWHHKWMFVGDDYQGFDVQESKERSELWAPHVPAEEKSRIGRKGYWESVRTRWETVGGSKARHRKWSLTPTQHETLMAFLSDELVCPYCGETLDWVEYCDILQQGEMSGFPDTLAVQHCCLDWRDHLLSYGFEATYGFPPEALVNELKGGAEDVREVKPEGDIRLPLRGRVTPKQRGAQKQVFDLIEKHHSHHGPPVGWKFGIEAWSGRTRVGVGVVGRPVSRVLQKDRPGTLEVTRVCVWGDPWLRRNAASKLYGVAAAEARRLGYTQLITYTLEEEEAASVRAAGFEKEGRTKGGSWDTPSRRRKVKGPTGRKVRWALPLRPRRKAVVEDAQGKRGTVVAETPQGVRVRLDSGEQVEYADGQLRVVG